MKNYSSMPAVPLFVHDPFFSFWDTGVLPTAADVRHWSDQEKPIFSYVNVDGHLMRFLGRSGKSPMKLVAENVTPLSSELNT